MFSGIIEAQSKALKTITRDRVLELHLERPNNFNDIKVGDSIAVNGICLTLEDFAEKSMQFAVAAETLHITGWTIEDLNQQSFNIERSLRLSDRIHGHLVSGHVDGLGKVIEAQQLGESLILKIEAPKDLKKFLWKKGSVAVNGVSLTVNEVSGSCFNLCLIPETLKITNLDQLKEGSSVNLEVDSFARAYYRALEMGELPNVKEERV